MGLTGWEATALFFFTPSLLSFSSIRKLVLRYKGITIGLGLCGFLAFYSVDLAVRVIVFSLFLNFTLLAHSILMWDSRTREFEAWGLVIGLIALVGQRFGFYSRYLIWYNGTLNTLGVILGLGAAYIISRDISNEVQKATRGVFYSLKTGIGLGSIIFMIQTVASSYGVIPRHIDLPPFPYGFISVFGLIFGLLISQTKFVRSYLWWIIGTVSFIALVTLPNSIAIFFSSVLHSYLLSVLPNSIETASTCNPGVVFGLAFFFTVFGNIALIWAVAYCFVPILGPEMRERSIEVMVSFIVLCVLGYSNDRPRHNISKKQIIAALIIVILIVYCPSAYHRYARHGKYVNNNPGKISGMMWAIHFGYDNFGQDSFELIAQSIRNTGANVVGLVETDVARPCMGNRDVIEWLEEELQMYSDYGPSTLNHTWGCALLSAYPIVRVTRENLPSPEGEIACLIDATLDVDGTEVDVIVVHFGNHEHKLDRQLQAADTRERVAHKTNPILWLGYLTAPPGSETYKMVTSTGLKDTTNDPKRWCLYILYKDLKKLNFRRIDTGDTSDTEIQAAEFTLK
eukprot:TRINITY_DN14671_c0_g1_i1.p1 TRINITY_DN14671_c0_g1~~TRINITY_DN14671_c0_g1_i1.p1  ORF type:complete len:569 (-),score=54.17 TRINITY_DN14671_c0_g1_i1:70-1776(-)